MPFCPPPLPVCPNLGDLDRRCSTTISLHPRGLHLLPLSGTGYGCLLHLHLRTHQMYPPAYLDLKCSRLHRFLEEKKKKSALYQLWEITDSHQPVALHRYDEVAQREGRTESN